jgi:hypothetical protein
MSELRRLIGETEHEALHLELRSTRRAAGRSLPW